MSTRGHVAHLTSVHPPFDRRISLQCASLAADGWTVTLVAQEGRCTVPEVKHASIPPQPTRLRRSLLSSWHVFRQAQKSGAQICHFHDPELLPVGVLLALLGRKVIYDVHEDMPLLLLNKFWLPTWLRRPLSWVAAVSEWVATRVFLTAVVAATPLIARRFPKETTTTVQNFPALPSQSNTSSSQQSANSENTAVYIGVLDKNRGVRESVIAIGLCQSTDAKLLLGGKFSGEGFEEACRALPSWARVDFRGWLDRAQVEEALATAKVGLITLAPLPNYVQAYPTKLFEYMAAGIPAVASDFPLLRTIIEDAQCGLLVDPTRPDKIAEAIDWLIDHPKEAAEMGANGKRAVFSTYNWPDQAQKLCNLYNKLQK